MEETIVKTNKRKTKVSELTYVEKKEISLIHQKLLDEGIEILQQVSIKERDAHMALDPHKVDSEISDLKSRSHIRGVLCAKLVKDFKLYSI